MRTITAKPNGGRVDRHGAVPPSQGSRRRKQTKSIGPVFQGKKNKEPESVGFFLIGLLRLLCT
jgi:hypothetical protein